MVQIYILLDAQILKEDPSDGEPWPDVFNNLFDELRKRNIRTVVKLAFVSYGPSFTKGLDDEVLDCTVRIPDPSRSARGSAGRPVGNLDRRGKGRRLFSVASSSGN